MGYIIVAAVLLIEIPRFAGAYSAVDTTWIPSIGTGFVLPIGAGYVFYTWLKTKEERKGRNRLLFWFYLLMGLESVILVPWAVSRLRSVPLSAVVTPGIDWLWTLIVMVSPFLMASAVVNGLALQVVKQKAETEQKTESVPKSIQPPTTRSEFLQLVKQHPDLLTMNSVEVMQKVKPAVCQKTVYNWLAYAKEHDGNHA